MLNYSLAKELKEAGFPQKQGKGLFTNYPEQGAYIEAKDAIYCPTLEELIEACEQLTFTFGLEKHSNEWRAGTLKTGGINVMVTGPTPTEAVARLLISLYNSRDGKEKTS